MAATSSADVSFGPPGQQWHYTRGTKTFDLTRGAGGGLTVKTTQGPEEASVTVAPALTALVVVDMQNFFLHPSCRDHPTAWRRWSRRSMSSRSAARSASR